jgi:hypothetical protein
VSDLLDVFRLYEAGVSEVLALPTSEIYVPQLDLIEALVGLGAIVEFVSCERAPDTIVRRLAERFHVRFHRSPEEEREAFLAHLVETLNE